MTSRDYIIYYENLQGEFTTIDNKNQIKKYDFLPSKKDYSRFFLPKGYVANEDGLKKYAIDFKKWNVELRCNNNLKIVYDSYWSHIDAVEYTFKRLCKGKYESHEQIFSLESQWMEKCFNTGIIFCKPGTYDSYGYDFSGFYPFILSWKKFKIPTKSGKETILSELPKRKELKVGYYHVEITCENEDARKVFSFSKHNVYTHYSLFQAMKYQKKFNFNIKLVQDSKPNAYLYNDEDCVRGYDIFGNWYKKLMELKTLFPKNALIKHLTSSLWGHLCRNKNRNVTLKDIEEQKIDIGLDDTSRYKLIEHVIESEKNDYYVIQDNEQLYMYNIRLKAFLTSFGRAQTAKIAMKDIDHVIRVHTDGIVFSREQHFTIKNLIPENKSTGLICWKNVNNYEQMENKDDYIPHHPLFS